MILCKHCGWPVLNVLCNCFNNEGCDSYRLVPIAEPHGHGGVAEFDLPTSWTGYELSEEEQMDTILCPHCKKFPFSTSAGINVQTIVNVVCFEETGDASCPPSGSGSSPSRVAESEN